MIHVQSLSRCFGKFTAVNEVSFHIGRNEIVGLLGHNGAGKTTIMKMLSGYLEPSLGSIRIAGINLATNARAVQQQLGYLPECPPVYPEMMVADYLDYVATLKGIAAKDRMRAICEAIKATDLSDYATHVVGTLSRGMKQRLGVAQAILGKPKLLILDEPTNGLDPAQTLQMRELIRELAKDATIILSTHIMQEVDALCDRVLMLRSGNLVLDESHENLRVSRSLALRTGVEASLESALKQLGDIAQVSVSTASDEFAEYTLVLTDGAELDSAANQVANCVLAAGAELYRLQPVLRDLDTVFQEANLDNYPRYGN